MSDPEPTFTRRVVRKAVTLFGTVAVLALAGGLVTLGTDRIAARAERAPDAEPAPAIRVATARVTRQSGYKVRAEYPGRIEARRRVELGFEAGGTVAEILVDEGAKLSRGAVVARLDTRALEARRTAEVAARAALAAEAELAGLTADRQKTLLDRDHVARQRYDEARLRLARLEAEVAASDARIAAIDVDLAKSTVRAPFEATVGLRYLDEGSTAAPGQAILSLIESGAPEFRVGVPADLAARFTEDQTLSVTIGGTEHEARVTRLRDDIDPATRTVTVTLELEDAGTLPDGTLGRLVVENDAQGEGFWVPAEAISEGLRGLWTLYAIDTTEGGSVARREAVELLHMDGARVFVRGALPREAVIVTAGPHRLADGQPVAPEG